MSNWWSSHELIDGGCEVKVRNWGQITDYISDLPPLPVLPPVLSIEVDHDVITYPLHASPLPIPLSLFPPSPSHPYLLFSPSKLIMTSSRIHCMPGCVTSCDAEQLSRAGWPRTTTVSDGSTVKSNELNSTSLEEPGSRKTRNIISHVVSKYATQPTLKHSINAPFQ